MVTMWKERLLRADRISPVSRDRGSEFRPSQMDTVDVCRGDNGRGAWYGTLRRRQRKKTPDRRPTADGVNR